MSFGCASTVTTKIARCTFYNVLQMSHLFFSITLISDVYLSLSILLGK